MIQSSKSAVNKKVLYAQAVYGDEEKQAVMKSLENGWLASGPLVQEFEQKIAKLFNKKYGIAVNSGSSANLLAVKAFGIPAGSEVITPACTFATTVSEIVNNGLVPVFVDSVIGRYTINEELVEEAIGPKTRAILVPQLVGGATDMPKLFKIAKRFGLVLIDDSCDTLAPYIGKYTVSQYAHVTTTSFYGSHIITACGMGGMVLTNNEKYRDKIVTLRDWGRVGNDAEEFDKRFDFEIDNIPYDSKFLYSDFGYNLKMNEVSAAFGLEQLKRLPGFIEQRTKNFNALYNYFSHYREWFYLPKVIAGARTNWLAFPLSIRHAPFTRFDFLKYLDGKGIQVRVLFSGNITRHPIYRNNLSAWRVASLLTNADYIMANGFLLGMHQGLGEKEIEYVKDVCEDYFRKF